MSISNDLLGAFEQRNVGKFQERLEVYQADPNFLVKTLDKTVFEIILNTPNSSAFIKLCIENGADFYMKNTNGQYPLHCVIASLCLGNLKQVQNLFHTIDDSFLLKYSPSANVKLDNGQNSLHMLADALSDDNYATVFGMMKILLSHGCNANFPNYDGKTAFFVLLERLPQLRNRNEILDYFLENGDIDFFTHRGDEIIEMVMNTKLKFELPQREDVPVNLDTLMTLLKSPDINKFETLFPLFKTSCADAEVYADSCSLLLEIAVERSLINIVDLLIDYGVDIIKVASSSKYKIPSTCRACASANPGILRLFLLHPKVKLSYTISDTQRNTLLHHFFDDYKKQSYSTFRRLGMQEVSSNQKKCFDMLMVHPKWNRDLINSLDNAGLPAIYYSVRYKKDYITLNLLKNGAYIGTAVKGIRKSLLEEFLNSTISTNDRFTDDDEYEIKIDYNFLAPPFKEAVNKKRQGKLLICPSPDQYMEEMKPLKKIAESAELRQLLSHPTIASFILLKWKKLSFVVYSNLLLIVLFMSSFIPFTVLCQTIPVEEQSHNMGFITFQVLSLIVLAFMILREVTQAMLSVKQYFFDMSNWVDIALMTSALIILLVETQIPNHLSRLLRTLVILLAAAEYFNVLGMVPILSVSIYTKMFKRVYKTFVKSLAFYSVMIVAFAFSFFSLQGDKFSKDLMTMGQSGSSTANNDIPATNATRKERYNNFYTVGSSIIKTFVMLTGELEGSYVHTEGISYALLFLIFIFLVSIVLYNLFNALAVSDTQEIKRDAKLIDLLQRIKTMQTSEEAIFQRNSRFGDWLKTVISLLPKSLPEGYVMLKPNRSYRIYIKQNEPIILNDWWLHSRFKFLKSDVTINDDIMKEIHDILIKRREEKALSAVRLLKENRNTKLAIDVIKIGELVHSIQMNVIKLQADLYSLRKGT